MWAHLLVGWVRMPQQHVLRHNPITYFVDPTLCDRVLPQLYEDTLLTWSRFDCDEVRSLLREAFDEWQHNSMLSFNEVAHDLDAHVTVRARKLHDPMAIAQAGQATIVLDVDECWYTDRAFCGSVTAHLLLILVAIGTTWLMSAAFGLWLVMRKRANPCDAVARVVNWTVLVSCPLLFVFAVLPCTYCFDLKYTMMHEIGHILGFGHTDYDEQMCGCLNTTARCALSEDALDASVMRSRIARKTTSCLSRNDVDGLRSFYGPHPCDDRVWCYESGVFTGHFRVALAIVYGFTVAWCIVLLKQFLTHTSRARRPRLFHWPPVARPPVVVARSPPRPRRPYPSLRQGGV